MEKMKTIISSTLEIKKSVPIAKVIYCKQVSLVNLDQTFSVKTCRLIFLTFREDDHTIFVCDRPQVATKNTQV